MTYKPPLSMIAMTSKMPPSCHALFVVADGKVNNPEFVVWRKDDFNEELWKLKRQGVRVNGRQIEFIAKHGPEYVRINIDAV